MTTRTTARWAAAGVLLLGGLTGCSLDASSAPTRASKADFCDTYSEQMEILVDLDPDGGEQAVRDLKDWAEEARDTGTPRQIPVEARRGFETLVEEIDALDADEVASFGEDLGRDAAQDLAAFSEYALRSCPEAVGRVLDEASDRLGDELGDLQGRLDELGPGDLADLQDQLDGLPGRD